MEILYINWIVFILYLIGVAYLSYIGAKKTKELSDFTVGGWRLGPWPLAIALIATGFSGAIYVGYVGWAYAWGESIYWALIGMALEPIGAFILWKRYLKFQERFDKKPQSVSEWLQLRYKSDSVVLIASFVVLFFIFYIASASMAAAVMFEKFLGIPSFWAIVLAIVIVMLYVSAGGTFSDVYTDVFQSIFMITLSVLIFLSGFFYVGGPFGVTEKLAAIDPILIQPVNPKSSLFYSYEAILGALFTWSFFAILPQYMKFPMGLEKTMRNLRRFLIIFFVLNFVIILVPIGGLYARVLLPQLKTPDYALPELMAKIMPGWAAAFFSVAVMAASMSTADGLYVVMATTFANDLYKKVLVKRGIFKPKDETEADKNALKIAKFSIIPIGLASLYVALNPPPIGIGLLLWVGLGGMMSSIMAPIFIGAFWRRATPTAATLSMLIGLVLYIYLSFTRFAPSSMLIAAYCTIISFIVMVVASLVTKPLPKEFVDKLFT